MKTFLVLLFLAFTWSVVAAQPYDHLLHKPYADKITGLFYLYTDLIALQDSAAIANKISQVKAVARKNDDRELAMEMDLFGAYHNAIFKNHKPEKCIAELKRLITLSEKENIWHINIRAIRVLAEYYWEDQKNYELAFEQYLVMERKLSRVNPKDYPEMARDLLKIGQAYYYFQDYGQAKKIFKKVIALPETEFNTLAISAARNTLGLCYQQENNLGRSDYYFNQILNTTFEKSKKDWSRIVIGNLGANMYLRKEYDKAIPMLETDYYGAIKGNDYGPAAGAAILLADIFLDKGQIETSWRFIERAKASIVEANQPDRLRLLYPIMSKWYSVKGSAPLAKQYVDSTVMAINAYNEKFSSLKILRAQQKINRKDEELRLVQFNLKTNERNMLIIVVAGLCIIMLLGYYVQQKRQLANDLTIQTTTQELEIATLNLNRFTESISEKNKLIEQLEKHRSEINETELIHQLKQSSILTEDDWRFFQQLFDKTYPGYILRAKHTYPDLSLGELRYFVLTKLNLSYKEMAFMQGVSPNTVQVIRHRIRKKLDFSDNATMEEAINLI